jgi:NSS family neurotransmitter:Na+ symporter
VLGCTALVSVIVGIIVSRGLQKGIEAANKVLMPLLFASLVVLAIGSLTLPGAMEGLAWYLAPDFSKLTFASVLAALGQVFFSIGIALAGAFVYGSYLKPKESDVPGSTTMVVAFDTMAAFTAGLVIFPAVFAFGLDPSSGPGLLFVTLASVFAQAPAGNIVGAFFFFLVFIAGITSAIGLVEALVASAIDSLGVKRKPAMWTILIAGFLVGIPSALSFGPWSEVRWIGKDPFSFIDFVSGSIMLPVGGLLIAAYTAYVWGFRAFQSETNEGARGIKVFDAWGPFIRLIIPIAVAVVLLSGLGLF